jgi:hypothetical protein
MAIHKFKSLQTCNNGAAKELYDFYLSEDYPYLFEKELTRLEKLINLSSNDDKALL